MFRKYLYPFALWLLLAWLLSEEYAPRHYVWPHDPALRQISPALHAVQAVRLLVYAGASLLGLCVLWLPSRKQQAVALLFLLAGWGLTDRWARRSLAEEQYAIWKYQVFEKIPPPIRSPTLLPLFLQDVSDAAEPFRVREKLVVALGQASTQQAYPVLRAIAQDPSQNPDLQADCLQSLQRLRPTQFAAVLASASTAAAARYRQREQASQ